MPTHLTRIVCLAFSLLFAASTTSGDTLRSNRHGYTIDMPEGWTRIPPEVIQEVFDVMLDESSQNRIVFDLGTQPADAEWLDYPYALVQVQNYRAMGLDRQITVDDFERVVSELTGGNAAQNVGDRMRDDYRDMMSDIKIGEVQLDVPNRRYTWSLDTEVQGVGPVRAVTAGHFGRDAMIQVGFYCKRDEWEQHHDAAIHIIESFEFDTDRVFDSRPAGRNAASQRAGGIPVRPLIFFAMGGTLIGLFLFLVYRTFKS